ncbi:hypothetical protein CRUP_013120 [Coryphaenoides rupestris]|nr:hypothetical protein CRUP_013120 [Coryphaenoides rupestris]
MRARACTGLVRQWSGHQCTIEHIQLTAVLARFLLKDDGKTCVDTDECSSSLPCSQHCLNTYGSYKCLCVDGYEALERNPNMCKALSAEEPFLIMADHHEIRKLSVDGSNYTILKQITEGAPGQGQFESAP